MSRDRLQTDLRHGDITERASREIYKLSGELVKKSLRGKPPGPARSREHRPHPKRRGPARGGRP